MPQKLLGRGKNVDEESGGGKRHKKADDPPLTAKDPDADMFDEEQEDDNVVENEEGGIRIGDIYIPPPPTPACNTEEIGPRLIITHIENVNFKSYAGKQCLGPFHKSFTAIIGPNGSGKSNVIDSMLFVFGYRAQKIRSKSVAVLIHNSENHPNICSCSVSVHFQLIEDRGDEDFVVVPNSKFVVTRTAFKDNASFYQIDGKRVQFKQVAKLLRSHGIDLDHNRFLILQGEVEQIAMMKPKAPNEHECGMLEFLEDIIGSSRYKEPTELLSQRVEVLNTQRTEKMNRVKLVEKEKDELEGPMKEALAYVRVENELAQLKHSLHQLYVYQNTTAATEVEGQKQEYEEEMGDLKSRLEQLTILKAEKTKEHKSCSRELAEIERKFDKAADKLGMLMKEDEKIVEDYRLINNSRKKAKETILTEKAKHEELLLVPEKNAKQIDELASLLEDLEKKKEKEEKHVNEVMANLQVETRELQDEKNKYELQLLKLKKVVNETQTEMQLAQSQLDIFLSTEKKEKNLLETMREQLETVGNGHEARESDLHQLEANLPEWDKQLAGLKQQLDKVTRDESDKSQELRSLRIRLEEGRSTLSASASRGKVLQGLMEQKAKGTLPGIFGRLGDLGAIDVKYDVAVSTAGGPLDHIVVDTVDTAQECIEFLKRTNAGVGSFIALDKQQHLVEAASRPFEAPDRTSRLYDLIRVKDDRVKPAFYYAVRNTLVADNLEQATKIGYGRMRYRIVTLKGELIEPSGTMSGGGNSCSRGRMGRSVATDTSGVEMTAQQINQMEQRLQNLADECNQLRQTKSQLEDALANINKQRHQGATDVQKWRLEIKALQDQKKSLKEQIKGQERKVMDCKSDEDTVKGMEQVVGAKRLSYEEAAQSASKIEQKVAKVHAKIMELTEGKMNSARSKLDAVNSQINKVGTEKTKLAVAIRTSERNVKKCVEKIESLQQEVQEAETDLRKMQERRNQVEGEAKEVKKAKEALEVTVKELKEKCADFKTQLDSALSEENKVRAEKIDYDQKIEQFETRLNDLRAKVDHYKKDMAKIKLHPVDGEGSVELVIHSAEDLSRTKKEALLSHITKAELELSKLSPNLQAINEYRLKEEIYLARVTELDEVTRQRDEQRKNVDTLRKGRLNEFMAGFALITTKLKELYQMITLGGDAELELVDSLDPFSEGIVFSVRPPKKSWKNISNLSGGEKTLSSLALVFALHYYKPTPLYVMDEIDAALDFKNVSIVGNYVKERTKNAQFIIISLRSNMFELADRLVGIYKTDNCTKSIAVNPGVVEVDAENRNPGDNIMVQ